MLLHFSSLLLLLLLLLPVSLLPSPAALSSPTELELLMQIKASLDPGNRLLTSWEANADPCGGSFQGVACNEKGRVANISLQGKGLSGSIPAAVGGLKSLTGLYLHFNSLKGEIPEEIAELNELSDLYLNVNNLSGDIPANFGNMSGLQVLQLCHNKLTGSIPTQLGSLTKLGVLALQYNQLTGAIPASLGELGLLTRVDLSFNGLFGSIPLKLSDAPRLQVLDIRNNSLSGNVPPALQRLSGGFQYDNNPDLCGVGFPNLQSCTASDQQRNVNRPESSKPKGVSPKEISETADLPSNCRKTHCSTAKSPHYGLILGVIGLVVTLTVIGFVTSLLYRRHKQKIGSACDTSDDWLSVDRAKESSKKGASPLISVEYSNGWDPLAIGCSGSRFSQEVLESFTFNLEEVEHATQCFSEMNLLGRSKFSATYKGILRDGSAVAVKSITKASCKPDEADFLKGLKMLISLKHENLVRLRGFCCSNGRGECFLIYDYVPKGNLLQHLDVKKESGKVLEWPARILIINGIAKGIAYLQGIGNKGNKTALLHENISADKVLIDKHFNPLLSYAGLHKLLADDIVFSVLKVSAAMGYLAPEYTTTGRFTEKSDIYAFGIIVLQIISGKGDVTQFIRQAAEPCRVEELFDANLEKRYSEIEAVKLGRMALLCTHECPDHRPNIQTVIQELSIVTP